MYLLLHIVYWQILGLRLRMLTDNKFRPPPPLPRQTLPHPLLLPLGTVGIQKPGHSCWTRPVNIAH